MFLLLTETVLILRIPNFLYTIKLMDYRWLLLKLYTGDN